MTDPAPETAPAPTGTPVPTGTPPPRTPPAPPAPDDGNAAEAPRRWSPARILSGEWALRVLALVLAVLAWTLARQEITVTQAIFVTVEPVPRSAERFVAFHVGPEGGGRIEMTLKGPQGEIDDARDRLGDLPMIQAHVPDLEPGEDVRDMTFRWPKDRERFGFRFRRLVDQIPDVTLRVFRLENLQARVAPPVLDLPEGYEARDVKIEPAQFMVTAPAGMVDGPITPDPVDVSEAFRGGDAQKPWSTELTFSRWLEEEGKERFREKITIPRVRLTARFVAREHRSLENGIAVQYAGSAEDRADDYLWEVTSAVPDLSWEQRRFKGQFLGGKADLDVLEDRLEDWNYVIKIPLAPMAEHRKKGTKEFILRAKLDWSATPDLAKRVAVSFVTPKALEEVQVKVTKKE